MGALCSHKDELEADFQQYYGLDLGRMGHGYSVAHAAVLSAQLPKESRVAIASARMDAGWSPQFSLLADVSNSLRLLVWSKTKDAERGTNRPRMTLPPSLEEAQGRDIAGGIALPCDEYKRMLADMHRRASAGTKED